MAGLVGSQTTVPRALSIAGFDQSGGAGLQADLKTFTVMGVYGTTVLTGLPVQNTLGVSAIYPITAAQVREQLDAVLGDIGTDAVKIGMLASAEIIEVVAERLQHYGATNIVVDPVMVAKSGDRLLQAEAEAALRDVLLPLATVVTPNVPEAKALTGLDIATPDHMREAAQQLLARGAQTVIVKGGHRSGEQSEDLFITASGEEEWLAAPRYETRHTHGTGCTFSAAIAAGLATGLSLLQAVRQAKDFITLAIRTAPGLGAGHGPTNHLAWLQRGQGTA